MLAYYHYPFVQNEKIREYTESDLIKPETVEELFDYCQILEAYITKKGWTFLIDYYGYEKLYEINKKSGWIDGETIEEYISSVQYQIDISAEE